MRRLISNTLNHLHHFGSVLGQELYYIIFFHLLSFITFNIIHCNSEKFPVFTETCRCNENLSISIVPNSLDTLGTVSLSRVIRDLVNSTCGRCDAYRHNYLTSSNITREGQISFPVTRTQAIGDTAYSKFVPVISVPGFVVVKRRNSPIPTLTKLLTNSIFESWPVCVLALLTSLLAGIIIWILVRFFSLTV